MGNRADANGSYKIFVGHRFKKSEKAAQPQESQGLSGLKPLIEGEGQGVARAAWIWGRGASLRRMVPEGEMR